MKYENRPLFEAPEGQKLYGDWVQRVSVERSNHTGIILVVLAVAGWLLVYGAYDMVTHVTRTVEALVR